MSFNPLAVVSAILANAGSGVDCLTKEGRTPLMWAAHSGQVDVIHKLIAEGADVNSADYCHRTAISIAAENGRLEVVELLIDAGADLDRPDITGATPLHWAAWAHQQVEKVEAGSEPKSQDGKE